MKLVVYARHGEAFKNIQNIYGGNGSGLTERGKEQVQALAQELVNLKKMYNKPVKIYLSCQRVQVVETGKILSKALDAGQLRFDEDYKPIRLGVFNGLSKEEQEKQFPGALKANHLWELGKLDITQSEKCVPGMQKASEHYAQIRRFIDRLDEDCINVLIGTRSDMSCLHNVFQGNSPDIPMRFKYNYFDFAQSKVAEEKLDKTYDVVPLEEYIDELNDQLGE